MYPVDFGSLKKETYFLKLTVGESYSVEALPESKTIVMPEYAAKYTYNVSQKENLISITSILQINKTVFTQDEYSYLREFYNQILAKQAEQIVLKRNGS